MVGCASRIPFRIARMMTGFRQFDCWVRLLLALATLGGALMAAATPAAAQAHTWTMNEILQQVDRGAKEFQSLTADVERTKVTVVVNDHSTESGEIRV